MSELDDAKLPVILDMRDACGTTDDRSVAVGVLRNLAFLLVVIIFGCREAVMVDASVFCCTLAEDGPVFFKIDTGDVMGWAGFFKMEMGVGGLTPADPGSGAAVLAILGEDEEEITVLTSVGEDAVTTIFGGDSVLKGMLWICGPRLVTGAVVTGADV